MAKQKFTLKQWRNIRGLTLIDVAQEVGVHFTTIARWEKEPTVIPIKRVEALEKALNINWANDVKVR